MTLSDFDNQINDCPTYYFCTLESLKYVQTTNNIMGEINNLEYTFFFEFFVKCLSKHLPEIMAFSIINSTIMS